jgi:hypothetical protein
MACRRIVQLRRGLLLWLLVGPTRATARRASVSSTEVSENRILGSKACSHCQPVAVENREAIRTKSMMNDGNARALTPMGKGSIAVLPPRLSFRTSPSTCWPKCFSASIPGNLHSRYSVQSEGHLERVFFLPPLQPLAAVVRSPVQKNGVTRVGVSSCG